MNTKIAIVTGSAKRVGAGIVNYLVQTGWNVIIHYNNSEKEAHELQNSLPKGSVFLLQQNFCKAFCENDFFKKILNLTLGQKPSLLINNASSFENDSIDSLETEDFLNQIKINCLIPILLGRAFAKNNPESNIINILDMYAFENSKNFASHQISKAALLKATKQMALEFADNTRVNSITPSFVIKNPKQNSYLFQKNIEQSLLKKNIEVIDICKTIEFLLNTTSITGQNIVLDCGKTILTM